MPSRRLSLLDATLLVMGGIVGVGIFYTPRAVAAAVPHPTLFLAMWAIGGLIALNGALTFAELGATFPRAGGWYVFLREAFGPFVAFLFAWVVLCVISTGACAVMMRICTDNLAALAPGIGPAGSATNLAVGAAILLLVTGIAMLGAKAGATFQNGCMLIKLGAIGVMAGIGLLGTLPAAPALPAADLDVPRGMVSALLPVLFACGGWQMVCYVAPEVRDPQRTLPRAIVIGILAVIVTYLAINAAYLRVLGIGGIAGDPQFAGEMARRTLGERAWLLQAAMAVSALGVCVVTIVATPWLYVAMAREGLFFERFGRASARTGAPVAALLVQAGLCLAYWFWGEADRLVDSVVFVEWIFHALVAVALVRLRATRPGLPRPFASPLYPTAPVLYLLFALAVVAGNLTQAEGEKSLIGMSVLAAGAVVYRPWRALVVHGRG